MDPSVDKKSEAIIADCCCKGSVFLVWGLITGVFIGEHMGNRINIVEKL